MPGSVCRAAVAVCLGWAALSTAAGPLPAAVEDALQRAQVPPQALVAVVQDAATGNERLAWQAERPVNPASLTKLVTTYAALDILGPAWRWSTPVWLDGPLRKPGPDGTLDGNLVIRGEGDPTLVVERLWLLLRRVRALGVRHIRGDIVLDRSAFEPPARSAGAFDGEPLEPYNVAADALLLNFGSLLLTFTPDRASGRAHIAALPPLAGVRIDASVALSEAPCDDWRSALRADFRDPTRIHFAGSYPAACDERQWPLAYADPPHYAERMLVALWAELGGSLGGRVRDGVAPATAPAFEVRSPALAEVVRDINKYSNNVMAQQLFLTLGLEQRGSGSEAAARAVLHDWLAERLGATADDAVIDNGSGLSRETRLSARLLARLLAQAWAEPLLPELAASLPLAGQDGTLRRSRAPYGRAHLKTGSLRDVAGVAGYVLDAAGRRQVVVAIVNHPNANAARPALDALVQWAAEPRTGN
ncbi:MAG: D-alanyl-D-alanine carboxypeptidase/D-alanyl-D-alanine-endopeptidase [Betaproteobacteria bacterium]